MKTQLSILAIVSLIVLVGGSQVYASNGTNTNSTSVVMPDCSQKYEGYHIGETVYFGDGLWQCFYKPYTPTCNLNNCNSTISDLHDKWYKTYIRAETTQQSELDFWVKHIEVHYGTIKEDHKELQNDHKELQEKHEILKNITPLNNTKYLNLKTDYKKLVQTNYDLNGQVEHLNALYKKLQNDIDHKTQIILDQLKAIKILTTGTNSTGTNLPPS